ncbi:UNVERIFIED_CONTAM: outer membrane receptor protein involved in Fe transport [Streptomyces graminofaciens]
MPRSRTSAVSARLPLGSRTRIESSPMAICSEKVRVTSLGAVATTAPSFGLLPVSAACAAAGLAPASSAPRSVPASTVTASSTRTGKRPKRGAVAVII